MEIKLFHLFILIAYFSQAQLKKSTLSINGGKAKIESHTFFYAVGQSAMIGKTIKENKRFIHGYLNPIANYATKKRVEVEWTVYPNPFRDEFTIQFPFDIDIAKVQLYDFKGIQVFGKIVQRSSSSVQISQLGHLSSSSYLLVIEYQGELYKRQIIHDK